MKIQLYLLFVAVAFAFQKQPSYGAEPAQLRPLLIHGDWEIGRQYRVGEKGLSLDHRDTTNKEWLRINRELLQVFRHGKEKPSESIEIKTLSLADQRDGVIELNHKNLGFKITFLYRFEGRRLLLCMSEDIESRPSAFAAKGTRIMELIPYQHNRLVLTCILPDPKPQPKVVFQNVAPAAPPKPPPVADPKK